MMRDPEQTIGNLIDRQNTSFVGSVDVYKRQIQPVCTHTSSGQSASATRMRPGSTATMFTPRSSSRPVSYTHLDVYKRQVLVACVAVALGVCARKDV